MDFSKVEVRNIPDPWKEGIARGWSVIDAATLEESRTLEADVIIIGTGAGGGVSAEILSQAGLKVVMVEAARLKSTDQFKFTTVVPPTARPCRMVMEPSLLARPAPSW